MVALLSSPVFATGGFAPILLGTVPAPELRIETLHA